MKHTDKNNGEKIGAAEAKVPWLLPWVLQFP